MKTSELTKKKFDAVKMMRDIRNQIDIETKDMTFEEEKRYFRKGSENLRQQLKKGR